jgi:hypothetical protein
MQGGERPWPFADSNSDGKLSRMHTFRTWHRKIDCGSAWLYWMLVFFVATWQGVLWKKKFQFCRPHVRRMSLVFAKNRKLNRFVTSDAHGLQVIWSVSLFCKICDLNAYTRQIRMPFTQNHIMGQGGHCHSISTNLWNTVTCTLHSLVNDKAKPHMHVGLGLILNHPTLLWDPYAGF